MSFNNWKAGPPTTDMSAFELIERGYRRTSNAYGLVSRIDRADWLEVLSQAMGRSIAEFYDPRTGAPAGHWCDHYRSVHSEDTHTVDQARIRMIPTSGHDPIGFVDVVNEVK